MRTARRGNPGWGRGWGMAHPDTPEEASVDLKELEKRDLGGGIIVRKVLPVGGMWVQMRGAERVRAEKSLDARAFHIVTLLWSDAPPGFTPFSDEPGGIVEARIYPPRPEDGPHGEGWLVTDCPGDASSQSPWSSFEAALDAVVADLRTYDAGRRLGSP